MRTVTLGGTSAEGKPLEPDVRSVRPALGLRAAAVPTVSSSTKGKVESGMKYVKHNFLPGRVFRDLADFNEQLALVAGRGRRCAPPRHRARAAGRALRARGRRPGAHARSAELLSGDAARAGGGRRLACRNPNGDWNLKSAAERHRGGAPRRSTRMKRQSLLFF